MANATLTVNAADALKYVYDKRRTRFWVVFNTENNRVTDADGVVRIGAGEATPDDNGMVTFPNVPIPSPATNPTSFQVMVCYSAPAKASGQRSVDREKGDFGWMTITGNANIKDLEVQQYVPPTYLTQVTQQLDGYVNRASDEADRSEAAADRAEDISNIGVPDDVIANRIRTATSDTKAALNEVYVEVVTLEKFGAVGDGVADDSAAAVALRDYATSSTSRITCMLMPSKTYKIKSGVLTRTQTKGLLNLTVLGERGAGAIIVDGQGAGTSFLDNQWTTSAATNLSWSITNVRFIVRGAIDAVVKNTDCSNGKFVNNIIEGERPLVTDVWVRNLRYWSERVKIEDNRELSRTVVNGGSGRVFFFDATGASVGTGLALSATDNTVTKAGHGLTDGWAVKVSAVVGGGLNAGTYYVINATTDTFQLAPSQGDAPLDITVDGTATVRTGSSSFKGAWVRNNEFTSGVPGVCKVDMTDDSACYDSIFGPHLGNIAGGDILQKLTGNMRGTRVYQPQIEASSDWGYSYEIGKLSGGNRPTIIGNFATQLHLREYYVSDATNAVLGLGVLGSGLPIAAATDSITRAAHGLIHDSRVQLASSTAGGVTNGTTYFATGSVIGTGLALSASADTVTAPAHGLPNGTVIELSAVTASGVSKGNTYYVVNATTDTFQLATALNGPARDITASGTATVNAMLPDSFKLAATRGGPALDITADGTAIVITETYALPPGQLSVQPGVHRGTVQNQQQRAGVDLLGGQKQPVALPINPTIYPSVNADNGSAGPFNRNDNLVEQLSGSSGVKYVLNRDGSVHWSTDNPTATSAELANGLASVNLNGKFTGKVVLNTTTKTAWIASGPAPGDPWYDQGATTYATDTLTADSVALATSATPAEIFTTATLSVGKWLVEAFICLNQTTASTAVGVAAQAVPGGSGTIEGAGAGASTQGIIPSNSTANNQTVALQLKFVVNVTSSGTISIRARASAAGVIAKATTPGTALPGATGYVATKLA